MKRIILLTFVALWVSGQTPSICGAANSPGIPQAAGEQASTGIRCFRNPAAPLDPERMWPRRLQRDPNDIDALRMMTRICLDGGMIWEALSFADRSAIHPEASDAEREKAYRQAGEMRSYLGYFAGAESNFKHALRLNPRNSDTRRLLAQAMRARPDEALAHAEQAARADDGALAGRAAAHLLEGELRIALGDSAGAEESLKQALALAPDDLDALQTMVRIQRKKRGALAVAKRADRAASKTPLWQRPAAYRLSARIWLELEEYSRAAESLRRALALNPNDLDALVTLVQNKDKLSPKEIMRTLRPANAAAGKPEDHRLSEKDSAQALKRNPNNLDALRSLIAIKREQKKRPEAVAYARRFMRSVWKTPVWQQAAAYRLLARLWLDLGNKDRAFQSVDWALDIQPDSVETMEMIFQLKEQMGEGDDDREIVAYASIYYQLAEMHIMLKDFTRAEKHLKRAKALKLDTSNASRLKNLIKQAKPKP